MSRRKASTEVPAAATTTSTSTVTPPAITYAATCFTLFVLFLFVLKLVGRSRQLASFTLTGKHIVITGGSSGIGKAIAAQVLKEGASVTLVARDIAKLERARSELAGGLGASQQVRVSATGIGPNAAA